MHALCFHERRPAFVMSFWAGDARGNEFALSLGNERLVLAMRTDDDAELLRERQRAVKLRVVDPESALVSEEDLEAADAALNDFFDGHIGGNQ